MREDAEPGGQGGCAARGEGEPRNHRAPSSVFRQRARRTRGSVREVTMLSATKTCRATVKNRGGVSGKRQGGPQPVSEDRSYV